MTSGLRREPPTVAFSLRARVMPGTGNAWLAVALLAVAFLAGACQRAPSLRVQGVEFTGPPGSIAPFLEWTADGKLYLTYTEPTPAGHAVRLVQRQDGGWQTLSTIVESDSLFVNWADFPSVSSMPNGTLVAHWLQKSAAATYAYHVFMRLSESGGKTWGEAFRPHGDTSPTEHGFVAMTPWQDGLAAVWLDGRNTARNHGSDRVHGSPATTAGERAMSLRFTTLAPGGGVEPDIEVDPRVCDCCQTALVATPSALLAAYRDRAEGEIRDIVVSRFANGVWSEAVKVYDDGWYYPGCPVNGPALAARGDAVAVAWFTGARDTAQTAVAFSTNGGVTFGDRVVVSEGRSVGRVDVAWVRDQVVVVWLEETADGGAVRARALAQGGQVSPPVNVATVSTARAAGFPRIATQGDTVFVAWTDPEPEGRVHVTTLILP